MRRHIRENFGRYLLCLLLMAAGIGAFIIATMADVDYWTSVAQSDLAKIEYGGGAVIFRTVTFLFACVVALQWRHGQLKSSTLAGFVLTAFALFGMVSIVGFNARERIAPTLEADARLAAEKTAQAKSEALSLELREGQIAFLREQAEKVRKHPKAAQSAYDALGSATFGTISVKPEPTEKITDPLAASLHFVYPAISVKGWQFITAIAWGIGLIIAEMMCMGFAVGMWPRHLALQVANVEQDVPDGGTVLDPFRGAIDTAKEGTGGAPSNVVRPEFKRPATEAPQASLFADDDDLDMRLSEVEGIEEFWQTRTRAASAATIGCRSMYRHYVDWATENDLDPASQQKFGRVLTDLGAHRDTTSRHWTYVGRALIVGDDDGEPELLMAA
jgi:hypothetical protein